MYTDSVPSSSDFIFQDHSQPGSVKFGLYVKTHEIKQLDSSLRQILLMPKLERQAWINEHEEVVNDLLDSFVSDSGMALEGLQLDSEALQLSIEFVTSLRDVMNTLRGIINESSTLSS